MRKGILKSSNLFLFIIIATAIFSMNAQALSITSSPDYSIKPLERWDYNITFSNEEDWRGNLTVSSTIPKLIVQDWNLSYLPAEEDIGLYYVNITIHDTLTTGGPIDAYAYQNFTLEVKPFGSGSDYLVLALVFGFGLIGLGLMERRWMFLAGIVWIYISLAIFGIYGVPWMLIGFGFGFVLLMDGAMHISEKGG